MLDLNQSSCNGDGADALEDPKVELNLRMQVFNEACAKAVARIQAIIAQATEDPSQISDLTAILLMMAKTKLSDVASTEIHPNKNNGSRIELEGILPHADRQEARQKQPMDHSTPAHNVPGTQNSNNGHPPRRLFRDTPLRPL